MDGWEKPQRTAKTADLCATHLLAKEKKVTDRLCCACHLLNRGDVKV
jgi:hypothetical protein